MCLGDASEILPRYFGDVSEMFRRYFRDVSEMFRRCFGDVSEGLRDSAPWRGITGLREPPPGTHARYMIYDNIKYDIK